MTKLEKELRDQVQAQEEFIDTELLWANVEPHLKKKRRRILPILFFLGAIAIGILSTYYIGAKTTNAISESKKELVEIPSIKKASIPVTAEVQESNIIIEQSNSNSEIVNGTTEYKLASNELITTKSATSKNKGDDLANQEIESINTKSIPRNQTLQEQNELLEESSRSTYTKIISSDKSNIIVKEQSPSQLKSKASLSIAQRPSRDLNSLYSISKIENIISPLPYINSLPILNSKYSHAVLVEQQTSLEYFVAGGLSTSPTNISSQSSEWDSHFLNRSKNETNLMSWHIRTGVRKQLSNNWSIKAGILLNKINRRSTTTLVINESIQLENVIIEKIIGPQGVEDVYGTIEVNQTTTKEVQRISTSMAIDLNLSLQREFRIAPHASLVLGPMLTYNLSYNQKGNIHPIDNKEYNLELDENNWFKSNLGLSLGLETGLRYRIANNMILETNIIVDHKLQGINNSNYGITDKRHAIHIGIGLTQSF